MPMSVIEVVAETSFGSKNVESRNRRKRKGRSGKACRRRLDPVRTRSREPDTRCERSHQDQLYNFEGSQREIKLT